jgi:pimeloyl-ACP methyl ester carboxylesterase
MRAAQPGEAVVLIHGLWMNRIAMGWLARRFRRAGWPVFIFGYASTRCSFERNVEKLNAFLSTLPAAHIHIVAHSMGGVLALAALNKASGTKLGRVLLLGAPVRGSAAASQFMHHAFGRFCSGASGALWQTFPRFDALPDVEIGSIAGTARIGLGRFFVHLDGPNDGVVRVEETQLPNMRAHRVLPVSHSGMLISSTVAEQGIAFLRTGKFLE